MQKRHFFLFILLFCFLFILLGTSLAQGGVVPTDPDLDDDGLTNDRDACPNQAGPDYNDGCPVRDPDIPADSDGDGTADGLDRCPDEAGDGANGGCPIGQTEPNPQATIETTSLDPAPTEGDCVVSTGGLTAVNMRQSPSSTSAIIAVLEANEWFTVLAAFSSPTQLYNAAMAGAPVPFLDMFPSEMDASNETWYLVQKVNEPLRGWVAEGVIRIGGDCEPFNMAEKKKGGKKEQQAFLIVKMEEVFVSSRESDEDEEEDGIVIIAIIGVLIGMRANPDNGDTNPIPEGQADFVLLMGGLDESDASNFVKTDLLEEGCEMSHDENGIIAIRCADGGMPSQIPICTHQELNEAGVFEEVCYNIEIPEGCVVDNSEAGKWHVSCEDAGEDGVQITPIGEDESIIDIIWYDDNTVGIGLLLPAVQKVREAANSSQ